MNTKREIHGLDQAVVLLMFALDRVFAHRVEGWRRARKGFRTEIMEHGCRSDTDIMVGIYPVGLPECDAVYCRFLKDGSEWGPYKGQIAFMHSAREIAGFPFDGSHAMSDRADLESIIIPRGFEEKFKGIIDRGAIYDCKPA